MKAKRIISLLENASPDDMRNIITKGEEILAKGRSIQLTMNVLKNYVRIISWIGTPTEKQWKIIRDFLTGEQ